MTKRASQLETSRLFGKEIARSANIQTDDWVYSNDLGEALSYLDSFGPPWVVKMNGLSGGKGVTTTMDRRKAIEAIDCYLTPPSSGVVLCKYVDGVEATLNCLIVSGKIARHWETWDYKRLENGDHGPLTASMGAVVLGTELLSSLLPVVERVVSLVEIEDGFLEVGTLTRDSDKAILVTEFNVHIGEPCVQAIVAAEANFLSSAITGVDTRIRTLSNAGAAFVVSSRKYPAELDPVVVRILPGANAICVPGNCAEVSPQKYIGNGRVCAVAAGGQNISDARKRLYTSVVDGDASWRQDIGLHQPRTKCC